MKFSESPHYGRVIVGVGILVMLACLGVARFAFGVLLPSMAKALTLSYAEQGYLGTGYFVGYMVMVALAPIMSSRLGNRATIATGLGVIALSMSLLGAVGGYVPALLLYSLTGMGSGASNISMMAMIANWFDPGRRGTATGLVIMGNGLGIILSGFLVPYVVAVAGDQGWRAAWVCLGGIAALVCVLAGVFLRNAPAKAAPTPLSESATLLRDHYRFIVHLGAIYFLFGVTYIVYATFFVTTLVDEQGLGHGAAGRFWAWVGFFSLFSGPFLGRLSDAWGRRAGLVTAYGVQTVAYGLAALGAVGGGAVALYGSVVLFGLTAWSVPAIMTAAIADRLGPAKTAQGFSLITCFLAVGQVAGPVGAGWMAKWTGGFMIPYIVCSLLTMVAIGMSLALGSEPGAES